MPVKLIHVSDIHFGSGESHGRLNPASGLNVRFEDFAAAFSKVIDFTIDNKADVFLFSGDAYKNASPEPVYQQAFARQLKRLSDAKIPAVLLVGNHDQILRGGASHSMSVFQSLEVPGLIVMETPQLVVVETAKGKLQIIGMPHVTRHILMTHEKYAQLTATQIDKVLVKHVGDILRDFYEQLDPQLPAVLTAHMMMDTARAGAEQELMVGYSMTFPLDYLIDERLDYVALGHVHGHQILRTEKPMIAYAGSLERVDFGEQFEDKGFLELDIARGDVSAKFHSIKPRSFITLDLDLSSLDNPTEQLIQEASKKAPKGCILRIKYQIQQNRLADVDEQRVRMSLPDVLSLRFKPEIIYAERPRRMPDLNEAAVLQPLDALQKYLNETAPDDIDSLMSRASAVLARLEQEES